jgi:hypothetical protein
MRSGKVRDRIRGMARMHQKRLPRRWITKPSPSRRRGQHDPKDVAMTQCVEGMAQATADVTGRT